MAETSKIPGELESVAIGGKVADVRNIKDGAHGNKSQAEINAELIEAVGTGGSVDTRISEAVGTEATRAQEAEGTLDGKIGDEQTRAEEAEGALGNRLETLEAAVGTGGSVDERIAEAVASKANADDVYAKTDTYSKSELNQMVTPPNPDYKVYSTYADMVAETVHPVGAIYRVSSYDGSQSQVDDTVFSEYAWDGTQYVFLSVKTQVGEVFDITAHNSNTKYADLAAALGTNGANIPLSLRKGGMSVKFVRSSDNKYAQHRLIANEFTTDIAMWQGVDKKPVAGSPNLVESSGVEQQNFDLKSDIENIATQINGGTFKNKDIAVNNYVFNTGEDAQTEVLIPLSVPVGVNGTQYIVYIQGNTKISGAGKFSISIKQGNSNATNIDQSLIGKNIYTEQRVILTVNNYTQDVAGNLRILYYRAGADVDIHVTAYRITFEDIMSLDQTIKRYGAQNWLNIIRFDTHSYVNTSGETVDLTPVYSSTNIECSIIPCQKGDKFVISGKGSSGGRLWAFADNSNNIISRADANVTENALELTAPNNAANLILNKMMDSNICYTREVSYLISNIKDWVSGNINLDAIEKYNAAVDGNQEPYTWVAGGNRRGILVPVEEGDTIYIKPVNGLSPSFLFIGELDSVVIGETIDNVGDKQIISSEFSGFVPSNANYCYILYKNSSNITVLDKVIVKKNGGIKLILDEIENEYVAKQTPFGDCNLNQLVFGSNDTISSWWFYPQLVSNHSFREKVFFGFVDKEGYSGVAELTCDSKVPLIKKNRLKKGYIDTHDSVSVSILDDGRLLAVFPDGHNSGNHINVRVSKEKYSVDEFEEPIRIQNASPVSYSQVHKINGKYYIFFRSYLWSWAYTVSEDLINWSTPVIFLRSNGEVQRYFLAKPISDEPNKLRFATYSNPSHEDTNIRCGYIDFESNEIYDSTGVKVGDFGGNTPVITDSLTILVQQPASPNKNRLFDLAVTPMDTTMFSYATFDNSSASGTDSEYFIYNNGVITKICDGGEAMWIPKSQGGVFFENENRILVGRSDVSSTGYDYIETYIQSENGWVLAKEIYKELKTGKYKNRNSYVLTDIMGRYALWFRGYYKSYGGNNVTNYDFDMDAVVYNISKNEIYW